jgi:hypothetical protein
MAALTFEAYKGNEPYIFVSYAHEDKDALADIEKLNALGYRIWYDVKIQGTKEWQTAIISAIDACTVFLVFVSQLSIERDWVQLETNRAYEKDVVRADGKARDIPILPVFFYKTRIRCNTDLVMDSLWRKRQAVIRAKYADLTSYYSALIKELPKETRRRGLDLDADNLGLGKLPSMAQIMDGKLSLSEDEQTLERDRKVQDAVKHAVYSVETVFQLTSEETDAVTKLGNFIRDGRSEAGPTSLLTYPLNIGSAYIAPLRLVTGLVTRLQENWPPLVASYSALVRGSQTNSLEDLHYFIEYCWLAWGPSVPTTSLLEDTGTNFMVVQVAYGDEANSLPMILRKDKVRQVRAAFEKLHDQQDTGEKFELRVKRGWPVRLENVLVVKPEVDPFFAGLCEHELLRSMLKRETPDEPHKVALYLPFGDEASTDGRRYAEGKVIPASDEKGAFYSTAYVWLMIESTAPAADPELAPGRVIPFFEHANLATSKGLKFLQHCLARKAIYHVLGCEADPDYRSEGFYRFATALFPEETVEILREEIQRLDPHAQEVVGRRLKISDDPRTWRSPAEVVRFADNLEDKVRAVLNDVLKKGSNNGLAYLSTSTAPGLAA